MTNEERVVQAETALEGYFQEPWSEEEAAIDFLTDLRHFCACHGIDFEAAARTSAMHYEAEKDRVD